MYSSLVNLPLLASLEEKSTYREFDCFLGAENRDDLEKDILVEDRLFRLDVDKEYSCGNVFSR